MTFIKTVTPEHINAQYDRVLEIIKSRIPLRYNELYALYRDFEDRIKEAPASGKSHYHNAYPGGYLDHILHVYDVAISMASLYLTPTVGGTQTFTREEVAFCALHHDLGKIGDDTGPQYIMETDPYWLKKGFVYKYAERPLPTTVYERTMYLLQKYGVKMSLREMVTIKLTDGLYDESNKGALMSNKPFPFDTALPYLMHWSDHMATIAEKEDARSRMSE